MLKASRDIPVVARRIAAHDVLLAASATFADAAGSEALKVVILLETMSEKKGAKKTPNPSAEPPDSAGAGGPSASPSARREDD